MKIIKIILLSVIFSGITACTPMLYISKANTAMDGRCTDIDGCHITKDYLVPVWKY